MRVATCHSQGPPGPVLIHTLTEHSLRGGRAKVIILHHDPDPELLYYMAPLSMAWSRPFYSSAFEPTYSKCNERKRCKAQYNNEVQRPAENGSGSHNYTA